jgi:signal transduction histidine kinase
LTPLPPLPALPDSRGELHHFDRNSILVARPIVFQGKIVGAICLESNMHRLFVRFERYIGIAALVMIASLLAARLVSSVSRRAIAGPIVHLAEVVNTFSTGKNYSVRASAVGAQAEIRVLIRAFNEMLDQIQQRDAALQEARENLERRVEERTAELTVANRELEAFSYSVSHDLRAPLRSINGFTQALLDDCADKLDQNGIQYLERVRGATQRMGVLIDDLLNLSRVTRAELRRQNFDIGDLARSVANDLQRAQPGREIDLHIEAGHEVVADPGLLRLVLENLLSNAWKFTSKNPSARIEFGQLRQNGESAFFVRDDGAGFDPEHTSQLFGPFQRLHAMNEFPGTGVGLATVQRIVNRHGGRVWAQGAVGRGATFYFTLA